mgnify:CR=1 FL=1
MSHKVLVSVSKKSSKGSTLVVFVSKSTGKNSLSHPKLSKDIADSLGLKEAYGALVAGIVKGSPAARAGLKSGDVILKFDGKRVEESRRLPRMVAETDVGKNVRVDVPIIGDAGRILEDMVRLWRATAKAGNKVLAKAAAKRRYPE